MRCALEATPRRERRTAAELELLISSMIRQHADCQGVSIRDAVFAIEDPGIGEPTWGATIDMSANVRPGRCAAAVAEILADLQEKYDLL